MMAPSIILITSPTGCQLAYNLGAICLISWGGSCTCQGYVQVGISHQSGGICRWTDFFFFLTFTNSTEFTILLALQNNQMFQSLTWLAKPCSGPARPFKPAAKDRYGSDSALPTRWQVWALTFPPSWSLEAWNKQAQRFISCISNKQQAKVKHKTRNY